MEFRVLGSMELCSGGRRWEISGARQQTVLAMVLLEPGRPVTQDQLIDAVWDGSSPPSAVATLHSCVYRIRRMLDEAGGPELRRGPRGYLLDVPECGIDAHRFEELVAAGRRALEDGDHAAATAALRKGLALWRGEAFRGIEAAAVRERAAGLAELRLDAAEACLTAELELGRHQATLGELEALTGEHPYREGFWALLMTALYRSGRQAAALEAYQRLYRLLDEELGTRPRPSLQVLQQRILAGAPDLEAARSGAPGVVPRMLPARLRAFTGRADQLNALNRLLPASIDGSSTVVASVAGTAGVGKTALAVHWAHQVADQFPDGQLYVNLRGFGPSGHAIPPAEAVRRFLDALGVPVERIPPDPEAQAALYRSLLAGRRMLVLLDNAADEEQVRPLLPASQRCLVLVTSRNRLQGLVVAEAAHLLSLDLLAESEAYQLLAHRIGQDRLAAEPDATRELIEHCAHLPLALAIVAARAATNPRFALRALAAQLDQTGDSLDAFTGLDSATDLRAVFWWSLDQVSPEAARLFRLLGLHPGDDIGAPATASLAGVPVERVWPLLAELCDAHLLTEHVPGRYVFHDLLSVYAYELVSTHETRAEQHAATKRVLDHYLHSAHAATVVRDPRSGRIELVEPEPGTTPERFTDADQATGWLEAERATLLEAIGGAHDSGFDVHAWQLAAALTDFLHRRGHWRDQINGQLIALDAAERLGDPDAQVRIHRQLAYAYNRVGNFKDARHHLEQTFAGECDDLVERGRTLLQVSALLARQGRGQEAIDHARQVLELSRRNDIPVIKAAAHNQVGWYLARRGEHERALEHCESALALCREFDVGYCHGQTLDSIGYIHHLRGDHRKAAEYFRRAVSELRQQGDRYAESEGLTHLGDARLASGDREGARASWREALGILDELGHRDAEQVRAKMAKASPELVSSTP